MKKEIKERNAIKSGSKFISEFKEFILRGNVMDMAIGVIIGTAFANIVKALTDDFINPLINGIGGTSIAGKIKIFGGQYLDWGHFVTSIINFVIMAFVLFLLLKFFNKLTTIRKKKEVTDEAPKKNEQTVLLEEIRDLLKSKK